MNSGLIQHRRLASGKTPGAPMPAFVAKRASNRVPFTAVPGTSSQATLSKLLSQGTPGPLGDSQTPANPKNVGKESQSIRLSRLLLRKP